VRREGYIERWLGNKVRQLGCLYYKFTSPGNAGVPDRLLVLPDGRVWFVELKDEHGRLSPQQVRQGCRLEKCKARVFVVYGMEGAHSFIDTLTADLKGEGHGV
jgi:hypothetical protein